MQTLWKFTILFDRYHENENFFLFFILFDIALAPQKNPSTREKKKCGLSLGLNGQGAGDPISYCVPRAPVAANWAMERPF